MFSTEHTIQGVKLLFLLIDIKETFMSLEVIIVTTIISVLAGILAISNNIFNLRDRFVKWRKKRNKKNHEVVYKKNYAENHPNFKFNLGHISNSPPGTCQLTVSFLNLSSETKFIEPVTFEFAFLSNKSQIEPGIHILNREVWPKRMEHGQRFYLTFDFHHTLYNTLFSNWRKGVQVYAICHSSTGDFLRSNSVDYDELVKHLIPLKSVYIDLSKRLVQKKGGSLRDYEASLWQLELFNRLTVQIAQQLQQNNIPILEYLKKEHGLVLRNFSWPQLYKDLEQRKISPILIVNYLKSLV